MLDDVTSCFLLYVYFLRSVRLGVSVFMFLWLDEMEMEMVCDVVCFGFSLLQ